MKDLNISLAQTHLHWEKTSDNLAMYSDLLEAHISDTDLIILPEMFTTGFSMNPAGLAEFMDGGSVQWMKRQAKKFDCVVTGSLIIKDQNKYYNRLIWMPPDGQFNVYDKRHLFSMAGEDGCYQKGDKRLIVDLLGWKICPLICYDLRFPVWSRNTIDYDLLIYIANWPVMRIEAWKALLKARAIENQSYVIGLNRIGYDGNDYPYSGNSQIYDGSGRLLNDLGNEENIYSCVLSKKSGDSIKNKLPFLRDRDHFSINQIPIEKNSPVS